MLCRFCTEIEDLISFIVLRSMYFKRNENLINQYCFFLYWEVFLIIQLNLMDTLRRRKLYRLDKQVSFLSLCICHVIKSGFESCNYLAACTDCVLLFAVFDIMQHTEC